MKKFILALILAFFLMGCTAPQEGNYPIVEFNGLSKVGSSSYTANGGTVDVRVQRIRGNIANISEYYIKYSLNGVSYYLEMDTDGNFDQEVLMSPGTNTLIFYVYNSNDNLVWTSASYSFNADIELTAVRVVLSWDTDYTDVDLHILDPDGNHAWYSDLTGIPNGELDIDDTDGYGPETFVLMEGVPGTYTVKVRYFSNGENYNDTHATVVLTVNEGTPMTYGPHTFTSGMANADDDTYDWTVATFSVTS